MVMVALSEDNSMYVTCFKIKILHSSNFFNFLWSNFVNDSLMEILSLLLTLTLIRKIIIFLFLSLVSKYLPFFFQSTLDYKAKTVKYGAKYSKKKKSHLHCYSDSYYQQ